MWRRILVSPAYTSRVQIGLPPGYRRFCRKRPGAIAQGWEATLLDPIARFLGMSAAGPLPECAPDFMVDSVERFFGRTMPMVVGPATNDGVQQADQEGLADGFVRIDDFPDFLQERVRVLLRRFYQWFAVVFAEILSKKSKPSLI